jgi:hypothetical protein
LAGSQTGPGAAITGSSRGCRHAFYEMNEARWPNLKTLLESDPRLQFGA